MSPRPYRLLILLASALLLVLPLHAAAGVAFPAQPLSCQDGGPVRCHVLVDDTAVDAALLASTQPITGLAPADLWSAYAVTPTVPTSVTVAIVDAGGAPTLKSDVATYRARFGLPPCPSCLTQVAADGSPHLPAIESDWHVETSLDAEMVAALCPTCHVLVVEADGANLLSLLMAVGYALSLHPAALSLSWGSDEGPAPPTTCLPQAEQYGYCQTAADLSTLLDLSVTMSGTVTVASSGDSGYGVSLPAGLPDVVAVGGTTLHHDPWTARGWMEYAWSGSGSGCSAWLGKPAWQADRCPHRAVADIGFVADPASGVLIYDSTRWWSTKHHAWRRGWVRVGGTSVGAPAIAALYARATVGHPLPVGAAGAALYRYNVAPALWPVTAGMTWPRARGAYHRWPLFGMAGPGWNGATGVGTPHGLGALTP